MENDTVIKLVDEAIENHTEEVEKYVKKKVMGVWIGFIFLIFLNLFLIYQMYFGR